MENRALVGLVEAGAPLIQVVIDARRYHEAQDFGEQPGEVERLRLLAVSDYQLGVVTKARGKVLPPLR
ncbi:hypothetical protein [Pseudomonas putida]|uniref:hypothetical protein n=1 Tax=Pseudomonas putida TaxID=303 RepID=UPI001BAFCD48|nr:hypothetical protein [Pseudomonas putida]